MKKLIVSIIVVTLLLSITSTRIAGDNKPLPPGIEKATFVHYEIPGPQSRLSILGRPAWDDTEDDFRLITGGVRWLDTISYEVNPAGSDLVPETVRITLETSSETWDTETPFELFASPTITEDASIGYDYTNRVVWGELDPGVIAVTYLWYYPSTKEIVEFDAVFNTEYTWSTTEEKGAMDLQNIATHELGHNGLDDLRPPKDWALTMYAYSSLEEIIKRTLGDGDVLGIQKLYGE